MWVCFLTQGVLQYRYIFRPPTHTSRHFILKSAPPPPPGQNTGKTVLSCNTPWGEGGGGNSTISLPGCVSTKVMDMGLFLTDT